ncbi:MAG: polysaccharide biosynthesis C-terminal domain-containing protein, partial [Candidatus Methylomirabilales bacterium]
TLLTRSIRYILLVLGPIVAIIVAFAQDILRMWLGTEFASQATLPLQILAVGVLVNSLGWVPLSLIQAVGRPDLTAKFHLAEVPIQVILVWLLVNAWGIEGAALAWSLRVTLDGILRFLAAARLSSSPLRAFVAEKVPHVVGLVVVFGSFAMMVAAIDHLGWLRIVLVMAMLFLVAGVIWRHLLDDADRGRVLALLHVAGA